MLEKENVTKKNYVTKIFNYLKSGPGIAILSFIFLSLGYAYMYSYIGYFNVSVSFYELNIFNDFFILILSFLLLFVPMLLTFVFLILLYHLFTNLKSIKNTWKKCDIIKIISVFIILFVSSIFWYKIICDSLNISKEVVFSSFTIAVVLSVVILAIISLIVYMIKSSFEDDIIDLIFIIVILVSLFLIFVSYSSNLGMHIAGDKSSFMIIDNEYVVLYSTSDYAIVSKYEIDDESKEIRFLTNETSKIDLSNKSITYADFRYPINIIR